MGNPRYGWDHPGYKERAASDSPLNICLLQRKLQTKSPWSVRTTAESSSVARPRLCSSSSASYRLPWRSSAARRRGSGNCCRSAEEQRGFVGFRTHDPSTGSPGQDPSERATIEFDTAPQFMTRKTLSLVAELLFRAGNFFGQIPKCRKKLSHFGQNVCKNRLINGVTVSFNATVRQMTEISQRPRSLIKNDQNASAK